jgi:uncharacterized protein YkwD
MKKVLYFALAVIVAFSIAWAFFLWQLWPKILNSPLVVRISTAFEQLTKNIAAPAPLVSEEYNAQARLTSAGVLQWTNHYRKKEGFVALAPNEMLKKAAEGKVKDMIDKQYFEHISPQGYGPDYWVSGTGYEYIKIGENLALGNFVDDNALLAGWMASPGHRANILNAKYSEIGIAVVKTKYRGQEVWMAVQEFGMPVVACQKPDESIRTQVAEYNVRHKDLETQIVSLREELENKKIIKNVELYNQKIDVYNATVLEYNSLSGAITDLINAYNNQVRVFNVCAGD